MKEGPVAVEHHVKFLPCMQFDLHAYLSFLESLELGLMELPSQD